MEPPPPLRWIYRIICGKAPADKTHPKVSIILFWSLALLLGVDEKINTRPSPTVYSARNLYHFRFIATNI
jgi:hypothetical protein